MDKKRRLDLLCPDRGGTQHGVLPNHRWFTTCDIPVQGFSYYLDFPSGVFEVSRCIYQGALWPPCLVTVPAKSFTTSPTHLGSIWQTRLLALQLLIPFHPTARRIYITISNRLCMWHTGSGFSLFFFFFVGHLDVLPFSPCCFLLHCDFRFTLFPRTCLVESPGETAFNIYSLVRFYLLSPARRVGMQGACRGEQMFVGCGRKDGW